MMSMALRLKGIVEATHAEVITIWKGIGLAIKVGILNSIL